MKWDPAEVVDPRTVPFRLGGPVSSLGTCKRVEKLWRNRLTATWPRGSTMPGFERLTGFHALRRGEPIVEGWWH